MKQFAITLLVIWVVSEAVIVADYIIWMMRELKKGNHICSKRLKEAMIYGFLSAPLAALFIVAAWLFDLMEWTNNKLQRK